MIAESATIAVLISGGGTTLQNLIGCARQGTMHARIRQIVSSRSDAGGLQFAADADIPSEVLRRPEFGSDNDYSDAIFECCRRANIDLVVMGGFVKYVPIPADFENRVMNIHPSLVPAFCGQGYYGNRVHQAVLDYGAKKSGCTVHFVDNEYDHGPIILQRVVDVNSDDTAESLAERIFEQECIAYPDAINLFADGRISMDGRRVVVS